MSQATSVEHQIDGEIFQVRYLDPLTASDMLVHIAKTIGPGLGQLASGAMASGNGTLAKLLSEEEGEDSEADANIGSGLAAGAKDFFERVDNKKLRWMIDELAKVSAVQKGEDWPELSKFFDTTFRGRPGLMYKWLWAALQTNFADFFVSLRPVMSQFGLQVDPGRSKSPTT